jgi:hypothetical protein
MSLSHYVSRVNILVALATLISSCIVPPPLEFIDGPSVTAQPPASATLPVMATVQLVTMESLTPSPTARPTDPIATATAAAPDATALPSPGGSFTTQCLIIAENLADTHEYSGKIILRDFDTENLMSFTASRPAEIFGGSRGDRLLNASVSPAGTFIAYNRVRHGTDGNILSDELEVSNANGVVHASLDWGSGWVAIPGWLDDARLAIQVSQSDSANRITRPSSYVVLDVVTEQLEPVEAAPPDVYDISPLPSWNGWGTQVHHPSLTHIAYLQLVDGINWAYALWDTIRGETLASLRTFNNWQAPVWSPAGDQFVVGAHPVDTRASWRYELYAFDTAGGITRLTNLTDQLQGTFIQSYSWSPDARYIAFWLNADIPPDEWDNAGQQSLAILDTVTGDITDYCIPGHFNASQWNQVSPPMWSLDGQQLLVENQYGDAASRVILVDITDQWAAQLRDHSEPAGWMK